MKLCLSLLALAVGVCVPFNAWAAMPLLDVPTQQPLHAYVTESVTRHQLLHVYPDGTFRGEAAFTRYELAVSLNDLLALLQQRFQIVFASEQTAMMDFNALLDHNGGDLSMQHWAAEAVSNVVVRGIMSGYPDMTFRGKQKVSRYELAVQLERLVKQLELSDSAFDAINPDIYQPIANMEESEGGDLDSSHWAYSATRLVLQKGLMYGQQNRFMGEQNASRYDLAVAFASLMRLLEKKNPASKTTPASPST